MMVLIPVSGPPFWTVPAWHEFHKERDNVIQWICKKTQRNIMGRWNTVFTGVAHNGCQKLERENTQLQQPRRTHLVLDDDAAQLGTHEPDAPVGEALKLDNLVCCSNDVRVNFVPVLWVDVRRFTGSWTHVTETSSCDVYRAPDRYAGITVLTNDIPVHVTHDIAVR